MSEKKRAKEEKEKGMDIGRLLGVIAREDPELYNALKEYAEREGVKLSDATINIIKKYFLYQKVEQANLNLEQVMLAWEIFRDIAKDVVQMYTQLGSLFFSEMTEAWSSLIQEQVERRLEAMKVEDDVDRELKKRLVNMMVNFAESMAKTMMKTMYKSYGIQVPEELKTKIPIEIVREDKREDKGVEVKVDG